MSEKQNDVSAEQVEQYLRSNPGFFVDHSELLADISLPHASGNAISLVERQVSVLRENNMDMRHRLSALLDNARVNDKLYEKTKRVTLAMLEGQDLGDIIDALRYSFDNEFKIPYTAVILYGDSDVVPACEARVVEMTEAREHIGNLIKSNKATSGLIQAEEKAFLFGADSEKIGSVATAPLIHSSAFGLLALGHEDPEYYRSSMGTLFLSYIAEVLNRLLPKHLPR
jgi:uncharacterized protein YigA (DUF484 family)